MTTIIGIKANHCPNGQKPGIILASDESGTKSRWEPQGDVAYKRQERVNSQKIYVDDNKEIAIGIAGIFDQFYVNFVCDVLDGKIDLKKAIRRKKIDEFAKLNLRRWEGYNPDMEKVSILMMATRFDENLRLHVGYSLGKLVEIPAFCSIGSGEEHANKYIGEQSVLIPGRLSLDRGVEIAFNSLKAASRDLYTTGLDIAVLTSDSIDSEVGMRVRESMNSAENKALKQEMKKYSKG